MVKLPKPLEIEDIPDSFWEPIDKAKGNLDTFREIAMEMSREKMRELWEHYHVFAESLFGEKHLEQLGVDISEGKQMDIACWVVMQGFDYYSEVYLYPEKTPSREQARGRSFAGILAEVFADRFGEWI